MLREGPNDGLVSVNSARWGTYEGTLVGVNHLGIINWVNRIEYAYRQLMGRNKGQFNALAFYCEIAGELLLCHHVTRELIKWWDNQISWRGRGFDLMGEFLSFPPSFPSFSST